MRDDSVRRAGSARDGSAERVSEPTGGEYACPCPEHARYRFPAVGYGGDYDDVSICLQCGKIHELPDTVRQTPSGTGSPMDGTLGQMHAILDLDTLNLERLREFVVSSLESVERDLKRVNRRLELFRRRFPRAPRGERTPEYEAALEAYRDDLETRYELMLARGVYEEALAYLRWGDTEDSDRFADKAPNAPTDARASDAMPEAMPDERATDARLDAGVRPSG